MEEGKKIFEDHEEDSMEGGDCKVEEPDSLTNALDLGMDISLHEGLFYLLVSFLLKYTLTQPWIFLYLNAFDI